MKVSVYMQTYIHKDMETIRQTDSQDLLADPLMQMLTCHIHKL